MEWSERRYIYGLQIVPFYLDHSATVPSLAYLLAIHKTELETVGIVNDKEEGGGSELRA